MLYKNTGLRFTSHNTKISLIAPNGRQIFVISKDSDNSYSVKIPSELCFFQAKDRNEVNSIVLKYLHIDLSEIDFSTIDIAPCTYYNQFTKRLPRNPMNYVSGFYA